MEEQTPTPENPSVTPPEKSFPPFVRFALWLLLAVLLSVGLAWLSITVQARGVAPLVLTSIVVGGVLGGLLVLLTRLTGTGQRRLIFAASLLLALVTAGMQHVFAYQAYVENFRHSVESNPKAAMAKTFNPDFGPAGFWGYMQAEGRRKGRAFMWSVDALVIVLSTAVAVWFGLRRPFCAKCHRWYHVVRVGVLPSSNAAATCEELGIPLPGDLAMARFRLLECQRGCGPAQLEVSWTTAGGKAGSESVTLDGSQRARFEAATKIAASSA